MYITSNDSHTHNTYLCSHVQRKREFANYKAKGIMLTRDKSGQRA